MEPRGALSTAPAQTRPGPTLPLKARGCGRCNARTEFGARGLAAPPCPMADLAAPPRDPVFAGCVGEPQQEIAMACERCAEADEVVLVQFVECLQQLVLIAQPSLMFCNDGRAAPSGPILNGLPHLLQQPM